MKRFDFAVIGGGPAGASAARRLAIAGASVAMFERRAMPRFKPCGGALSRQAMSWLDFPVPDRLINRRVFGIRVHVGGAVVEAREARRVAVLVSRAPFDHYLVSKAEEAGAAILWREVRSLEVGPDGATVSTSDDRLAVRCTIVCEGANRRLGRAVAGRDPPGGRGFCLQAEIPAADPDSYADLGGLLDIYFAAVGYGYGWVFHHGSHYNVGVGSPCSMFDAPLETFRQFVAARGLRLDGVRTWGHFLPSGGLARRVAGDRVLLAGDAAGFVDPFQGEGLAYAIRSGQLAAETVLEAARTGDFSRAGLASYEDACYREFGRDLVSSRRLMRIMHGWPSVFINGVLTEPPVVRRFLEIAAGRSSYRRFLGWLLLRAPWFWLHSRLSARQRRAQSRETP